jgi:hypothetical protein
MSLVSRGPHVPGVLKTFRVSGANAQLLWKSPDPNSAKDAHRPNPFLPFSVDNIRLCSELTPYAVENPKKGYRLVFKEQGEDYHISEQDFETHPGLKSYWLQQEQV